MNNIFKEHYLYQNETQVIISPVMITNAKMKSFTNLVSTNLKIDKIDFMEISEIQYSGGSFSIQLGNFDGNTVDNIENEIYFHDVVEVVAESLFIYNEQSNQLVSFKILENNKKCIMYRDIMEKVVKEQSCTPDELKLLKQGMNEGYINLNLIYAYGEKCFIKHLDSLLENKT